jgi:hypothetical protein
MGLADHEVSVVELGPRRWTGGMGVRLMGGWGL